MRLSCWFSLTCCAALVSCGGSVALKVKCTATRSPGRAPADLTGELARATAGECVIPQGSSYQGNFVVPAGVKLLAREGEQLTITGTAGDKAAITLNGGAQSGLYGASVDGSAGTGVDVVGGPAKISKLKVARARDSGLRISCTGAECLAESNLIEVTEPDLRENATGLAIFGARVTVTGGFSVANTSSSLNHGYGVAASAGAIVVLEGTQLEGNLSAGVVVDGTGGTSLRVNEVKVLKNLRGIWAQGLVGTDARPMLVVSGKQTLIDGNRIVGVGAVGSAGILISDAHITNTVKVDLFAGPGLTEGVGDGVGLFNGTGGARIERVLMENNQRSQMVVDKGGVGIIIPDFDRVAGGDFKLVVQNTLEKVTAPAELLSMPGRELLVNSPVLAVPKP